MRSIVWGGDDYPVTQPFRLTIHDGIDIGCPAGTRIYAARSGVVERTQTGMLSVRVGSQCDFYLHGDRFQVHAGQAVARGQLLMFSGAVQVDPRYRVTGPHLHFEVQNGFTLPGAPPSGEGAPLNPMSVLVALAGNPSHTTEAPMTPELANVLVRLAYFQTRDNEPSQAELDNWLVTASKSDADCLRVVVAILDSPEGIAYRAKVAALVAGAADDDASINASVAAAQATANKVEAAVKAAAAELAKA